MRRSEREIKDKDKIIDIIKHMKTIRIAISADGAPYIVPMSFGFEERGGKMIFYLHSAKEGRKITLLSEHPEVGFELDECLKIKGGDNACSWTAEYVSIIGTGTVSILSDRAEKIHGLETLMKSMTGKEFTIPDKAIDSVAVLSLSVKTISAKGNGFISF